MYPMSERDSEVRGQTKITKQHWGKNLQKIKWENNLYATTQYVSTKTFTKTIN